MILNFKDPYNIFEVSRWWFPGQWLKGGEKPTWNTNKESYRHHHPVILRDRAYLGYWDAGFIILDISDIHHPKMVSHCNYSPPYGGAFHTALPIDRELKGRNWLIAFQESIAPYNLEGRKLMWIIDITYEKNPITGETDEKPVCAIRQDGSDTTMLAQISEDVDFKDVYIGMPLRVVWSEEPIDNMSAIDHYEPIDDDSKDMQD